MPRNLNLSSILPPLPLSSPHLQVGASCPAVCECPAMPLSCPPGVSAVADGCGCCKVCASQLNQDCSPTMPCDHHKGLECNYGNDVTLAQGICRGKVVIGGGSGAFGSVYCRSVGIQSV